ncbi:dTDP-4-dehydrorhamnose 3,5-epimerase or related enzyme [Halapricum desulfuricans]|uniref:dTDP-4-dehydrorhamnose 3,5-epimerase n=1 Tax=Halapricum desulfuricans TaxID=2841257 RepID=A0A897NIR0_9EURY|nr:dTDP-4-dehydrorhamnose 3,5-epimerase [Halapricum desulfuricans]QSG11325.1 dTDP-4-dehydrorhamnose 3,5-epimerase or related enzyme [Halapricum desulfuricans]
MDRGFEETEIDGVALVHTPVYRDERGRLQMIHDQDLFESAGRDVSFQRTLYSRSDRRVLRGLHIQTEPYTEAKLVSCLHGEIFDVAVDLRRGSETYGDAVTVRLSGDGTASLFIPRGFAHGFVALADDSVVHYMSDNEYAPDHASGVHWADHSVGIDWPVTDPVVAERDEKLGSLAAFTERHR